MKYKMYDESDIITAIANARCKYIGDRGFAPSVVVLNPSDIAILTGVQRSVGMAEIYNMQLLGSTQIPTGSLEVLG